MVGSDSAAFGPVGLESAVEDTKPAHVAALWNSLSSSAGANPYGTIAISIEQDAGKETEADRVQGETRRLISALGAVAVSSVE
jgi:hypothetical protein